MVTTAQRHERLIARHLPRSVRPEDIEWSKCELCWQLARHYADCLPLKYRAEGRSVLEKSKAFRLWFLAHFERFNCEISTCFTEGVIDSMDLGIWMAVQHGYFMEMGIYPDAMTIRCACDEWKKRDFEV